MTTLAAMLGALPLLIATGPGSELRRPLGMTIIGGLLVSQVLTLYTTPVIYLLLDRLHRRLSGGGEVRAEQSEPAQRRQRHSIDILRWSGALLRYERRSPRTALVLRPLPLRARANVHLTHDQLGEGLRPIVRQQPLTQFFLWQPTERPLSRKGRGRIKQLRICSVVIDRATAEATACTSSRPARAA